MSSQIRNFIIAFVIAAVVFSGIAVVAVDIIDTKVLNPGKGDGDGIVNITPPAPPEDTVIETDDDIHRGTGNTFNFLLIGTDVQQINDDIPTDAVLKPEQKNQAVTLLFAMFNKEKNEFVLSPIPRETLITVDGIEMTIGDAYHYKDEKYIADKVSVLVGIAVDYYMSIPISEFASFIDYVGGVECNVPVDIDYFDDRQNTNIIVEQGNQKLNGSTVLGILRYSGFDSSVQKITFTSDVFMQTMHNITSDYLNKQQYATLYAYFTQNMKTNFTFDSMKNNVELIFKFTTMTKTNIIYPGEWKNGYFTPNVKMGNQEFAVYR